MDKLWKANERAIARMLGGKRVIEKGLNMEDITHPVFSIEAKSRKFIPKWLLEAMAQSAANAPSGKVPIVVVHQVGEPHVEDLVMIRLGDFAALVAQIGIE